MLEKRGRKKKRWICKRSLRGKRKGGVGELKECNTEKKSEGRIVEDGIEEE